MKNTFGSNISVTLFGESHGKMIGAVLDGIAPGIRIDHDLIRAKLNERKPKGKISTKRNEADEYEIVSGEFNGMTTGTPLTLIIANSNTSSKDYSEFIDCPRPSHADYSASVKYSGFQDYRGGGHFSGRITAALVAAGAILEAALRSKGIYIGTHIKKLGSYTDRDFENYENDIKKLDTLPFPTLDPVASDAMVAHIEEAAAEGDSVGGILESAVYGIPAGVGEPWFDSVEGVLSHILFSVPAVKGVEFGLGFGFAERYGSEANDAFMLKDGSISTKTNNNGGINGGITNGMPIIFRCAIKPTPSIYKTQATLNLRTGEETELGIKGRHDPAIIHRARTVIDAVTAIAVADLLSTKYGTDWLR